MHSPKQLQQIAVRSVRASDFSLDDAKLKVSGYVNETGKKSDPIPNWGEVPDDGLDDCPEDFVEVMNPGVFRDAINNADFVDFYFEHEPDRYLSSTREGSLSLTEDSTGLKMSANITPTSWGKDAYTLIKSGAVRSMSFGFIPIEDKWDMRSDVPVRTVTKIQLIEVSAVRFPAYPDSSIDARKKRFNHLNKIFEKRGYTLRASRKHNKRGEKQMVKAKSKKPEKRDESSSNGQLIANALNSVASAVDKNTNALQESSEVSSDFASKVMNAINSDRSKKTVKKSEKREDKPRPQEHKSSKRTPKIKKQEAPKNDGKRSEESKIEKSKAKKRSSAKYSKMFNELDKMDA